MTVTTYRSSFLLTWILLHSAVLAFLVLTLASEHKIRVPFIFHRNKSARGNGFDVDRYFRAMDGDFDEYRNAIYTDTPEVQRAIYGHQHPSGCENARFLIFEMWNNGLGSDYLGASTALAIAIATGRVLVLRPPKGLPWYHSIGCDVDGPQCVFRSEHGCTIPRDGKRISLKKWGDVEDDSRVIVLVRGPPWLLPVRNQLDALLPRTYKVLDISGRNSSEGYRSVRFWHTQATLYLLRLNKRTAAAVREGLAKCPHSEGLIGVPVRATDKCQQNSRAGEMRCVHPNEIRSVLERVRAAQPWLKTALVTSESAKTVAVIRGVLEKDRWMVATNTDDLMPGTGRAGAASWVATQSALVTITCQLVPNIHVLSLRSNFHSLIDMLAKTVPGRHSHVSYSIGDPWRPS